MLGRNLLRLRLRRDLSEAQLALRIGESADAVRAWEADQTRPDSLQLSRYLRAVDASDDERLNALEVAAMGLDATMPADLGPFLAWVRQRHSLTRAHVCARMGISRYTIHRWEQGVISLSSLAQLLTALGASDRERLLAMQCAEQHPRLKRADGRDRSPTQAV